MPRLTKGSYNLVARFFGHMRIMPGLMALASSAWVSAAQQPVPGTQRGLGSIPDYHTIMLNPSAVYSYNSTSVLYCRIQSHLLALWRNDYHGAKLR